MVVMGEDWQTAEAMMRVSDLLHWFGLRQKALLLWNLNSLMSLHRINWGKLSYVTTICTVSKYMKHRMWNYGVNPLVIPNGIPARHLNPIDQDAVKRLREISKQGDPRRLFLFKIGRFDPDKRWLMAIEAVARLKYSGYPVTLFVRGGIEPHGANVLKRAYNLGLNIRDVVAHRPNLEQVWRPSPTPAPPISTTYASSYPKSSCASPMPPPMPRSPTAATSRSDSSRWK